MNINLPESENTDMNSNYRCGFVALVGRPNVGKSTLMNAFMGQKISIMSAKPQTTRHRILGVETTQSTQVIYVDTPGIHKNGKNELNRMMNKAAISSILGVDLICFLVDATRWTKEDEHVLSALSKYEIPVFLVINKVDLIPNKAEILPLIDSLNEKFAFADVFPISASHGDNVQELKSKIIERLPFSPPYYDADQLTDKGLRFMVSELIREKIFIYCHQELPYVSTVEIESIEDKKNASIIHALIWVERDGQKKIIIGKDGINLKRIGSEARSEIETWIGKKVSLQLWVKVKSGWSDDERTLRSFGYSDAD